MRNATMWLLGLVLIVVCGCRVSDAVLDGLYGGISDTVSTYVTEILTGSIRPD